MRSWERIFDFAMKVFAIVTMASMAILAAFLVYNFLTGQIPLK